MKKGFYIQLALVALVSALAYTGTLDRVLPAGFSLSSIPLLDKALHFLFVGGIVFFWTEGWDDPRAVIAGRSIAIAPATTMVVATCEEALQAFSPHRNADMLDWLADVAGALFFHWLAKPKRAASAETVSAESVSAEREGPA